MSPSASISVPPPGGTTGKAAGRPARRARTRYRIAQRSPFCGCGAPLPVRAGRCRRCARAAWTSRVRFGGWRDTVLDRDGRRCRGCGAGNRLHVHHRFPGVSEPDLLVTLCARCHIRVHRLARLRAWLPEILVDCWCELHPAAPLQFQFALLECAA